MDIDHLAAGMAWFCLSIPLTITVFFRFNRVWSLRNMDLILLLCVAAGVVTIRYYGIDSPFGRSILISATGLLLIRLLGDRFLVRRPRIESNLSPPALTFLAVAAVAVVTVAIVIVPPPQASQKTVARGEEILRGEAPSPKKKEEVLTAPGPVSTIASAPAVEISDRFTKEQQQADKGQANDVVAGVATGLLAGLGHLAVLAAILFIGIRHFKDRNLGIAMATLYLMLPSTAIDPNSVSQILSAAWILWALALYRVAWASGLFMGLACGSLLYPAFLLPVWFAYYGWKQSGRFAVALVSVWVVLLGSFAILSPDAQSYIHKSLQLIATGVTFLAKGELPLTWRITDEVYRARIIGAFAVMLVVLTIWPRNKRFEHLAAASAAVIVGIQFWYPQQVGAYLTGYIPLVILIVFRPKLMLSRQSESASPTNGTDHPRDPNQFEPEPLRVGDISPSLREPLPPNGTTDRSKAPSFPLPVPETPITNLRDEQNRLVRESADSANEETERTVPIGGEFD